MVKTAPVLSEGAALQTAGADLVLVRYQIASSGETGAFLASDSFLWCSEDLPALFTATREYLGIHADDDEDRWESFHIVSIQPFETDATFLVLRLSRVERKDAAD